MKLKEFAKLAVAKKKKLSLGQQIGLGVGLGAGANWATAKALGKRPLGYELVKKLLF